MPPVSLMNLIDNFVWTKDPGLDSWRILRADAKGKFRGDCDDFALTAAYLAAGGSLWRMWFWIVTFRLTFWFVEADNGGPHIVLWRRDWGWIDNIYPAWRKQTPHHKRFPVLFPVVALKMVLGRIAG